MSRFEKRSTEKLHNNAIKLIYIIPGTTHISPNSMKLNIRFGPRFCHEREVLEIGETVWTYRRLRVVKIRVNRNMIVIRTFILLFLWLNKRVEKE